MTITNFLNMKISVGVFCLLSLNVFAQIQRGGDIDGESTWDRSGWSVSMPDEFTVAIGAPSNIGNGVDAGHVRVYEWNGSAWIQKGIDIDGSAGDWSGLSVSMPHKNYVAIGAYWSSANGANSGRTKVYRWNGTTWIQMGASINGESPGDNEGYSVSMPDSNTLAVGAPFNSNGGQNIGQVRIFAWNGLNWVQKGGDINGEAVDDCSGSSISMPDPNTVAIGANLNDGNGMNSGHVRVYSWNGVNWVQKGADLDSEGAGDYFGNSVSMSDADVISIGAVYNSGNGNSSGHVRVFRWNGNAWVQKGLDIDGESVGDQSGTSVDMYDSNLVIIGAVYNSNYFFQSGHARIYKWNGNSWVQLGMDIDGEFGGDFSGYSVCTADGNTFAIGAPTNPGGGNYNGHVRIYDLTPLGIKEEGSSNFLLYPNPSKGLITIESERIITNCSIVINNVLGQEVKNLSFESFLIEPIQLDMERGIYFVNIHGSNSRLASFKMIVQ